MRVVAVIRVLAPGLHTTVQDLGRPGHAGLGISACGAADAVALRIGNRLLGNAAAAAALEMTLMGATLELTAPAWIALSGADCAASRGQPGRGEEHAVPMWTALAVGAGELLRCRAIRGGARTYLCVGGGLEVPLVLGSAATHVRSRMGGLHGRALRAGDTLRLAAAGAASTPGRLAPWAQERLYPRAQPRLLRVTDGPQQSRFERAMLATLCAAEYTVSDRSDRMGVRLSGPPLRIDGERQRADSSEISCAEEPTGEGARAGSSAVVATAAPAGELLSQGVPLGAVQIPADGQPILLSVDQQTTGGYPVPAVVIAADLSQLGQLRPGERVRLARVSLAAADALLQEQERLLRSPALIVESGNEGVRR